jgi:uncharacterized protein (DUF433 family)
MLLATTRSERLARRAVFGRPWPADRQQRSERYPPSSSTKDRLGGTPRAMSELPDRITINKNVREGRPVIRGTRLPVVEVLDQLSAMSIEEICDHYDIERLDVVAAIDYAANVVEGEIELEVTWHRITEEESEEDRREILRSMKNLPS